MKLGFTNNQAYSGLFSVELPILQGDTPAKIALRLARTERGVKGNFKHLWIKLNIRRMFFVVVKL